MPSRPLPPNSIRPILLNRTRSVFLILTISSSLVIFFAILYFIYHIWHSLINRSRTIPLDVGAPLKLQRFTYKELQLATNDFDDANVIGKGGSGTVFRGITRDGKLFAVKRLDSFSLQTETEFQNELHILGGLRSPFLVTLLGYCVEKRHRLLVYEFMPNKSLQELLFSENGNLWLNWERRFSIILDAAKALEFMHFGCDPPVIHGDIKPSNILLDSEFRAKISDFGLSRVKIEGDYGVDLFSQDLGKSHEQELYGNIGTLGGESTPQTAIGTPTHEVDFALALQASSSSKNSRRSYNMKALNLNSMGYNSNLAMEGESGRDGSTETKGKEVPNDVDDDSKGQHNKAHDVSCDDDLNSSPNSVLDLGKGSKQWGRDWWWKQNGSDELCSKDYVREWIGSQIYATNPDWDYEHKMAPEKPEPGNSTSTTDKLEDRDGSRFDTLEEEFAKEEIKERAEETRKKKKKKHRKIQEWWKEEHGDGMSNKKRRMLRIKMKRLLQFPSTELGRRLRFRKRTAFRESRVSERGVDGEFSFRRGWRRKGSRRWSMGSDMWSGDLFSRELSSTTTSMRGTLCYIAPEYGGTCGFLMEKGDIYSFGVMILVIISGRRPLHVLASPMKLEKANLVSWARHLAQSGNLLELVDEKLNGEYDRDQASLCVHLALACLEKSPELRPDISEVVTILKGDTEFSPSPPPLGKCHGSRSRRILTADAL